jgi:hypothetical protein
MTPRRPDSLPRHPSREGKRVVTVYLNPDAFRQIRQLALDRETSSQALYLEALNLLFKKYQLKQSA